ncbi:MAG: ATP-binding cassette domain-containing protein [Myxococcota bacterium]|jgi:oligopeptide/dipeptide ABC transporter ATP-binding protein|nr:ATP-binding cassette domain-containing protein [Myxococcota bacterium]
MLSKPQEGTEEHTGEGASAPALLSVRNLVKHFVSRRGLLGARVVLRAVDGVSFDLGERETLALVGESGCGKSTAGRTILRLYEPTAGQAFFRGQSIFDASPAQLRLLRRKMQMVFQDPYASLNPRMNVEMLVGDALLAHGLVRRAELRERVSVLLEQVGLRADVLDRYPHEFSGGQRQRIGIARALALEPAFVLCDEPVSALDVSVQAQILNLFADLQERHGLGYLFVAHDLSVVRHISQRVCVMYLGQIVETAPTEALFEEALHPYTQALMAAIPRRDPKSRKAYAPLEGELPSATAVPAGCRFHPRCPRVMPRCSKEVPVERELGEGRRVCCHLYEEC